MLRSTTIYACLTAFLLQTMLFNLFLFSCSMISKSMEQECEGKIYKTTLSENQYKQLSWLNKREFIFKGYLFDVEEVKQTARLYTIHYKVDLTEKGFLEKLAEHLKNLKAKKNITWSSFTARSFDAPKLKPSLPGSDFFYTCITVSATEVILSNASPPPKA